MTKHYKTIREARAALSLDCGFDPFISGGWGRPTKAKLAEHGYVVDSAQKEMDRLCPVCGASVQCDDDGNYICTQYIQHKFTYVCDAGHYWMATEKEAKMMDYKCPTCGDYSV